MTEVFNAAEQPFDQYWNLLLPGAALLLTLVQMVRGKGRKWLWGGLGLSVFLALIAFGLPLADHRHVQAMAASDAVHTVEGPVSGHKRETRRIWTGTSRGVGVSTSNNYRTSTEEQFWVGQQWFWFEVGGMPSHAAFTNIGDPPLPLKDGSWARVAYVRDPWYQDEARIVRLAIADPGAAVPASAETATSPAASADDSFAAFWKDFSAAAGRGDQQAVRARTRFPFLFAGTPLEAGHFPRIWEALFAPAPLRQCLAVARPVADRDQWSVSCGVYVYMFERGKTDGWRFSTFTADPEAAAN